MELAEEVVADVELAQRRHREEAVGQAAERVLAQVDLVQFRQRLERRRQVGRVALRRPHLKLATNQCVFVLRSSLEGEL